MEPFHDFVFYKCIITKTSLTAAEDKFYDTSNLDAEICSGGWHSLFYQIYTWTEWSGIIEVLRFIGHSAAANAIDELHQDSLKNRLPAPQEQGSLASIKDEHPTTVRQAPPDTLTDAASHLRACLCADGSSDGPDEFERPEKEWAAL